MRKREARKSPPCVASQQSQGQSHRTPYTKRSGPRRQRCPGATGCPGTADDTAQYAAPMTGKRTGRRIDAPAPAYFLQDEGDELQRQLAQRVVDGVSVGFSRHGGER